MVRLRAGSVDQVLYAALYMAATRTQIYLTDEQRRRLDARSRRTGATLARMVREAVDAYLVEDAPSLAVALDDTFGALPDLELVSRDEWDRGERGQAPGR
jgi:ribbon-helix-helix protein